MSPLEVG